VSSEDKDDTAIYAVVMNHEEQYSIWRDDRAVPAGWRKVGKSGPKQECLEYINEVWTDMRPLSLRRQMEADAKAAAPEAAAGAGE
jgi:MbtH protein